MGERERVAALPRSLFAKGPRVCPSRENEKGGGGDDRRVREREGGVQSNLEWGTQKVQSEATP